jgi:hypothetical protein
MKQMFPCLKKWLIILMTLALFTTGIWAQEAEPEKTEHLKIKAALGVAITPRNFPSHSTQDVDNAFQTAAETSDHAVFIYQWHELNMRIVKLMLEKSKRAGLKPILGLSPTTLDQNRKELDIPPDIRRKAGPSVSFANPIIRRAYIETIKKLAGLQPPFLCLATEINLLAMQRLSEFLHFTSLYKEAYEAVKRISSGTKVFVSFQWEWMRIIDAKEPHKITEHSKVIDVFRPQLDLVGFTTYPSPFHGSPEELPHDYYLWMYRHIKSKDEVLLMEVGWPTQGSGNEIEQQAFIQHLPKLLDRVNVSVIAWALLHDVGVAEFDTELNTVGLITNSGQKKPGYNDFKLMYDSVRKEEL